MGGSFSKMLFTDFFSTLRSFLDIVICTIRRTGKFIKTITTWLVNLGWLFKITSSTLKPFNKIISNFMLTIHFLLLPFKPQQLIKCKLVLSTYSQLCVVQYGEIGRWSLVGVRVCLTINSPNTGHIFCSGQVVRIKVGIFGALHLVTWHSLQGKCTEKSQGSSPVYVHTVAFTWLSV